MIPKRLFQLTAVFVVLACSAGGVAVAVAGREPFATIVGATGSRTLGILLGLLAGLVASLFLIVPLRALSDMRPISEDIAGLRKLSIDDVRREKAKLDAMRTGTPSERRRFHLRMAAASFGCLFVGGALVAGTLEMSGDVHAFSIATLIYGVFGPPVHLALAFVAGRER